MPKRVTAKKPGKQSRKSKSASEPKRKYHARVHLHANTSGDFHKNNRHYVKSRSNYVKRHMRLLKNADDLDERTLKKHRRHALKKHKKLYAQGRSWAPTTKRINSWSAFLHFNKEASDLFEGGTINHDVMDELRMKYAGLSDKQKKALVTRYYTKHGQHHVKPVKKEKGPTSAYNLFFKAMREKDSTMKVKDIGKAWQKSDEKKEADRVAALRKEEKKNAPRKPRSDKGQKRGSRSKSPSKKSRKPRSDKGKKRAEPKLGGRGKKMIINEDGEIVTAPQKKSRKPRSDKGKKRGSRSKSASKKSRKPRSDKGKKRAEPKLGGRGKKIIINEEGEIVTAPQKKSRKPRSDKGQKRGSRSKSPSKKSRKPRSDKGKKRGSKSPSKKSRSTSPSKKSRSKSASKKSRSKSASKKSKWGSVATRNSDRIANRKQKSSALIKPALSYLVGWSEQ